MDRETLVCNIFYPILETMDIATSTVYLKQTFITQNMYMSIELNACALLVNLMTLRDQVKDTNAAFLTWLLGCQSHEKLFRSARSMTSTFRPL